MMEERREYPRRQTALHATVRTMNSVAAARALTRDVSAGGTCLVAHTRISPGSVFQSELTVPGHHRPVSFTGQVVWIEPLVRFSDVTPQTQVFELGCRFLDISPDAQAAIVQHSGDGEPVPYQP
jgi:c-di-GMP-binding flagellar brake protein YcgR